MTKKQLYIIIAILSVTLVYVLCRPTAIVQAPEVEVPGNHAEPASGEVQDAVAQDVGIQEVTQPEIQEQLVLTGVFVGLLDGEDPYQKKFKYLLLNDGEEVLRIDLRPLVGMSDINIIEKLGVTRGEVVTVTGVMNAGEFTVERIE